MEIPNAGKHAGDIPLYLGRCAGIQFNRAKGLRHGLVGFIMARIRAVLETARQECNTRVIQAFFRARHNHVDDVDHGLLSAATGAAGF